MRVHEDILSDLCTAGADTTVWVEGFEWEGSDCKSYTVLPFVSPLSLLTVLRHVLGFICRKETWSVEIVR